MATKSSIFSLKYFISLENSVSYVFFQLIMLLWWSVLDRIFACESWSRVMNIRHSVITMDCLNLFQLHVYLSDHLTAVAEQLHRLQGWTISRVQFTCVGCTAWGIAPAQGSPVLSVLSKNIVATGISKRRRECVVSSDLMLVLGEDVSYHALRAAHFGFILCRTVEASNYYDVLTVVCWRDLERSVNTFILFVFMCSVIYINNTFDVSAFERHAFERHT